MNSDFRPRVGFIGAGRVGTTLGKYFHDHGADVSGYYSKSHESAQASATFTDTACYNSIAELTSDCNMLFITVPDGQIGSVWNEVSKYDIKGKCICHCSGAMSSSVFNDITGHGAFGYSVHPLCAVSSKENSYKNFSDVFFAVEGSDEYRDRIIEWLRAMGNPVSGIASDKKVLYHVAAVFASNLGVALYNMAAGILADCGIEADTATKALSGLYLGNCQNIVKQGAVKALTGPVDRNDITTINKHIEALAGDHLDIYKKLSLELIKVASVKNPDTDYSALSRILSNATH